MMLYVFVKKWEKGQYVLLPFVRNLKEQGLEYRDMLTYLSLRSFNNVHKGCFPSHTAIGKKVGMSRDYVIDSIARLEDSRLISVKRSDQKHKSNYYNFEELISPLKVPIAFFGITDLTTPEKSMLLCLSRILILGSLYTIKRMSQELGLTEQQVYKQYRGLLNKGYIKERLIKKTKVRSLNYDKLSWRFSDNIDDEEVSLEPKLRLKIS
jgi:hypothetical protein